MQNKRTVSKKTCIILWNEANLLSVYAPFNGLRPYYTYPLRVKSLSALLVFYNFGPYVESVTSKMKPIYPHIQLLMLAILVFTQTVYKYMLRTQIMLFYKVRFLYFVYNCQLKFAIGLLIKKCLIYDTKMIFKGYFFANLE